MISQVFSQDFIKLIYEINISTSFVSKS